MLNKKVFGVEFLVASVVVIFLIVYNFFLIDVSLQEVRFALGQVKEARGVIDYGTIDTVLQDLSVSELAQDNLDIENMLMLEGSKSLIEKDQSSRGGQVGVGFFLTRLNKSTGARGNWVVHHLNNLMTMGTYLNEFFEKFTVLKTKEDDPIGQGKDLSDFGLDLVQKAQQFENVWQFELASAKYYQFLYRFLNYKGFGTIKARYGLLQGKLGYYDDGRSILRDVARDFRGRSEADLAHLFLSKVNHLEKTRWMRDDLDEYIKTHSGNGIPKGKINSQPRLLERLKAKTRMAVGSITEAYFELGILNLQLYHFDQAYEAFKKAVPEKESPIFQKKVNFLMGWTLKLQKKYEESKKIFEAVVNDKRNAFLQTESEIALALVAKASGNSKEAAERFEKIAEKIGSQKQSLAAILEVQAAYTYLYDLNDLERAKLAVQSAKNFMELDREFMNFLNRDLEPLIMKNLRDVAFQYFRKGNAQEANNLFKDALSVDQNDPWTLAGLGLSEKALSESPDVGFDNAKKAYDIIADEFTSASLAFFHELRGETAESIGLYEKAIQLNSTYLVALYNLGRLYLLAGQYDKAIEKFNEIIRYRDTKSKILARAYNNLGYALWHSEKLSEAERAFLEALENDPELVEANYNLALHYEHMGNQILATQFLEAARKLNPFFIQNQNNDSKFLIDNAT